MFTVQIVQNVRPRTGRPVRFEIPLGPSREIIRQLIVRPSGCRSDAMDRSSKTLKDETFKPRSLERSFLELTLSSPSPPSPEKDGSGTAPGHVTHQVKAQPAAGLIRSPICWQVIISFSDRGASTTARHSFIDLLQKTFFIQLVQKTRVDKLFRLSIFRRRHTLGHFFQGRSHAVEIG